LITITQKKFSSTLLEGLLLLTRPGATLLLLGLLFFTYFKRHHYTFLALAVLIVFLLKDVWTTWVRSDARRLHLEIARDHARFDPDTSIDIQMADKKVTHHSPRMLRKDTDASPLLLFPPSSTTLKEMNG
jgi:hypothetical protein